MSTPSPSKKGLLASSQRVLALDFGQKVTGPRPQRLQRLPAASMGELRRAKNILGLSKGDTIPRALASEVRRTSSISQSTLKMASTELRRRPRDLERFVPSTQRFSRNTANNLDTALQLFGIGKRPMREVDDLEHRTDHQDTRPEATWWQRLRRRLPI